VKLSLKLLVVVNQFYYSGYRSSVVKALFDRQ